MRSIKLILATVFIAVISAATAQKNNSVKPVLKESIHHSFGKIIFVFTGDALDVSVKPANYNFQKGETLTTYVSDEKTYQVDTVIFWFKNINQDRLSLKLMLGKEELKTVDFQLIKKEAALQTNLYPSKLTFLNKTNNQVIYIDDAKLPLQTKEITNEKGAKEKYKYINYNLYFNNPITEVNLKSDLQLKANDKICKSLIYGRPSANALYLKGRVENVKVIDGNMQWSDNVLCLSQWDSTNVIEDINNKGTMINAPLIAQAQLALNNEEELNKVYELKIPAGTFTDFFGNKNEELTAVWRKRKK